MCELCISATPGGMISAKKLEIYRDLTDVLWGELSERCHQHAATTFLSPGHLLESPFSLCKRERPMFILGLITTATKAKQNPKPPTSECWKNSAICKSEKAWLWRSALLGTHLLGTFCFWAFSFAGHWLHLLERGCAPPTAQPGFSRVPRGWLGLEIWKVHQRVDLSHGRCSGAELQQQIGAAHTQAASQRSLLGYQWFLSSSGKATHDLGHFPALQNHLFQAHWFLTSLPKMMGFLPLTLTGSQVSTLSSLLITMLWEEHSHLPLGWCIEL